MQQIDTYEKICEYLEYENGLVEKEDDAVSPYQKHFIQEAKRQIKEFDAIYFSGDIPVIYFKRLIDYNVEEIKYIHKLIWNQSKVPLLYIITPREIRIYNCYDKPVSYDETIEDRLIKKVDIIKEGLEELNAFSKKQIDTGLFWTSDYAKTIDTKKRADITLLENLKIAQYKLYSKGLPYSIIHNILGRSIFILYLEDRKIINKDYYNKYMVDSNSYFDVIKNKIKLYRMYVDLENKFNGDLFPVTKNEILFVNEEHLEIIKELFLGTELSSGQRRLFRPYDFSVIPIELISSIYETFIHSEKEELDFDGTYYTPHNLVEFIFNEILPWPSEKETEYNIKILDPTCGSGVFLVEAYKRLIARWKYKNKNDPNYSILKKLLIDNIYGVDLNQDAIKVTAFSLYLALLDYVIEKSDFDSIKLPTLIYKKDKKNKNLYVMDVIEKGPFENINYDIIVGNPPWKRNRLRKNVSQYCVRHGFAQESVQAFLWRARDFTQNGRIALVTTSKILVNKELPDINFRKRFFNENYVEAIINFSAFRMASGKGKQLFSEAVGPATIIIYKPEIPEKINKSLLYFTPKQTPLDSLIPGIIIDQSEIKSIPRVDLEKYDFVWKTLMWGKECDYDVVKALINNRSLSYYLKDYNWIIGRGFQPDGKQYESDALSKLSYIPSRIFDRYWFDKNKLVKIHQRKFYRIGSVESYYAPHVLIKRGLKDDRICAAFLDYDCAFTDSIYGISSSIKDIDLLKTLTMYLNSSIITYLAFLTSASWGIERPRVDMSEILQFPGIPFMMNKEDIKIIAKKYDEIKINIINETFELMSKIEKQVDEIFYKYLNLSKTDILLIEDFIENNIELYKKRSLSSSYNNTTESDLREYANIFTYRMNKFLKYSKLKASAIIYIGDSPLNIISIYLDETYNVELKYNDELNNKIMELNNYMIEKHTDNVYIKRSIKIYENNVLHIIKPSEKIYWQKSSAVCDADEVIADGITGRLV